MTLSQRIAVLTAAQTETLRMKQAAAARVVVYYAK